MTEGEAERPPWLVGLQELHALRGRPRLRELGQQSGMSHQAVADYLNGVRKPPLDKLHRLVRALGGDEEVFEDLWRNAREEAPPATPTERELLIDILAELRAIHVALDRLSTEGKRVES